MYILKLGVRETGEVEDDDDVGSDVYRRRLRVMCRWLLFNRIDQVEKPTWVLRNEIAAFMSRDLFAEKDVIIVDFIRFNLLKIEGTQGADGRTDD